MKTFAELHVPGRPLLLPNVWDFGMAAALAAEGFEALGTTSLGVAAAAGVPDASGEALPATLALTRRLTLLPCHVTVDLEAGDPETAAAVAEAGAAGVNVEDGRPGGLADVGEQVRRIEAIADGPLFVNARTDTHWLRTPDDLGPTLERVRAYRDAGADGVFVPGLVDPHDIGRVVAAVAPTPVNVLLLPGGPTPAALAELGVARISLGSLLYRTALAAVVSAAHDARGGRPLPDDLPIYREMDTLVKTAIRDGKRRRLH